MMKKRTLINEVRQLQKIAGLLKEDDLDLADTPTFSSLKKQLTDFVELLHPPSVNDELFQIAIDHAVKTESIDEILLMMADTLGSGADDPYALDGVFTKGDIESAAIQAKLSSEIIDDIMDSEYVERLEAG